MPKLSALLKPSSKSFSRRRRSQSHSSVKIPPENGTGVSSLSPLVPNFSSTISSSFSLSVPSTPSSPLHLTSTSPRCQTFPACLTPESPLGSSMLSLIPPSSPSLSASAPTSVHFSSATASDSFPSASSASISSTLHSPSFVTEIQQSTPTAGIYTPNSGLQHDALFEYVKGLQEAIKGGDADFAERILQELGESAFSPSAVALIVSANGARLIASAVRQFRWHGLQKPAKGSMKGGRVNKTSTSAKHFEGDAANLSAKSGASVNTRSNDGCLPPDGGDSYNLLEHLDGKSLPLPISSHLDVLPTSIVAPNESRRKRQRTSGELEEEDDAKEGFAAEVPGNLQFISRSGGEASRPLHGGAELGESIAEEATGSRNQREGNSGLGENRVEDMCKDVGAKVVRIKGRYTRIVSTRRLIRDSAFAKDRAGISDIVLTTAELDASGIPAVAVGGSELRVVQEENITSGGGHDGSSQDTPPERSLVPEEEQSLRCKCTKSSNGAIDLCRGGQIATTEREEDLADGPSSICGGDSPFSPNTSSECSKFGASDSRIVSRPPNKKLQVGQSASGLQTVLLKANLETVGRETVSESASGSEEVEPPSGEKKDLGELEKMRSKCVAGLLEIPNASSPSVGHSGVEGSCSVDDARKTMPDFRPQGLGNVGGVERSQTPTLMDKRSSSRWCTEALSEKQIALAEHVGNYEKKREISNVYSLVKGAGMPDVVAEGCNALDKLATTAYRGKGAAVGSRMVAVAGVSAAKRGKTLSPETYVALTEAFIDLLQILKDNVALLSWCLCCLGSILPPSSNDRNSSDSSLSIPASCKAPYVANKELLKASSGMGAKVDGSTGINSQQQVVRSSSEDQALTSEVNSRSSKAPSKWSTASYAAAAVSAGNGKNSGLASPTSSGLASESTASSISALAAVAYATVPMLAEKAVKAVLNAMQSCDIEAHSTHAALRALSAHLSSTNSKYVCDDAFAFIIAAMREFVSDAEMQAESCIALVSLPRAVSSATGHAAWAAITVAMDHHCSNLMVQRAGCGTLQLLCTRTGLGVPEWGSGKRPLRAAKDADRETGVRALIAAMTEFPEDVRIQWHGCSTLWTLVHSAGVRSVANMVRYGAVAAVVGAMSVCRINELMQQEGCNVLGTMARTLAENGHDVGPLLWPTAAEPQTASCSLGSDTSVSNVDKGAVEVTQKPGKGGGKRRDRKDGPPTSPDDWWAALWAVVSAMKAFNKSKSLQSNGTFALGCILKGSGENIHSTSGISPLPGMPLSNSKPSESGLMASKSNVEVFEKRMFQGAAKFLYTSEGKYGTSTDSTVPQSFPGKDVVDDVERMNAAVEVTMTAMREFPKVETVQVWGCAVLQQAFLAYVHYAKRLAPVSMGLEASLSAALSASNGPSFFPPFSDIFQSPSCLENTNSSMLKSSTFGSTSTLSVSCAQSISTNCKGLASMSRSKSSPSLKASTPSKPSSPASSELWPYPPCTSSTGQATDHWVNLDGGESGVTGKDHLGSPMSVLQSNFVDTFSGHLGGLTTSSEKVYSTTERVYSTITPQSPLHSGSNANTSRCGIPVVGGSSGESFMIGTKDKVCLPAPPVFSAVKMPSRKLSCFGSISSSGSVRGTPCTSNTSTTENLQKADVKPVSGNGYQCLGSKFMVEKEVDQGCSSHNSAPQSTLSRPERASVPSPCDALANLILSQATAALCLISGTMALSYTGIAGSGVVSQTKSGSGQQVTKASPKLAGSKSIGSKSPTASGRHSFASVRQSWCGALGAIGDVFGHLTRSSEVALGKGLSKGTDFLEIYKDRKHMHQLGLVEQAPDWNAGADRNNTKEEVEEELSECDVEATVTLDALTIWTHNMAFSRSSLTQGSLDVKAFMDTVVQQYKDREKLAVKDKRMESSYAKCNKHDRCVETDSDGTDRGTTACDWPGLNSVSQQQALKDIKAWQEATESMAKIAERVGFPMSVKNAILAIRAVLYKLEDAETVIWACHALVSLYLTWENVHLFRPGIESDREGYKSRIWGEGEVGVLQLVDLILHWTDQNRPDVTSLGLQALYSACVFAATVQEIEEVFGPGGNGVEAVLGSMQRALNSGGTAQQRRKVIQQACCVLTTVCGYSTLAQVALAAAGGADVILAALDRYDEDTQIQVNGIHALGLDARLQPDFDTLWNAAIYRTSPCGAKWSRRKRGSSASGATVVGLAHIYKEGIGLLYSQGAGNDLGCQEGVNEGEQGVEEVWTPQFERLVLEGASQLGLFRTALIASPGCGGPAFAVKLLERLSKVASYRPYAAEMQVHVCLIIGHMAAHNAKWRHEYITTGAVESVLTIMQSKNKESHDTITSFGLMCDGVEVALDSTIDLRVHDSNNSTCHGAGKATNVKAKNGQNKVVSVGRGRVDMYPEDSSVWGKNIEEKKKKDRVTGDCLDERLHYAASWALAGLVKDCAVSTLPSALKVVQALAVALFGYGGMFGLKGQPTERVHVDVCTPARLALARLGIFRIGIREEGRLLAHDAAEAGDIACLEALVNKGVDILMADLEGQTALVCAEKVGRSTTVQFLKDYAQLQGRKKAREKAKAKSKQTGRKSKPLVLNGVSPERRKLSGKLPAVEMLHVLEREELSTSKLTGTAASKKGTHLDKEDETLNESSPGVMEGGVSTVIEQKDKTDSQGASSKMISIIAGKDGICAGTRHLHKSKTIAAGENLRAENKAKGKEKKAIKGLKVADSKVSEANSLLMRKEMVETSDKWSGSMKQKIKDSVKLDDGDHSDCATETHGKDCCSIIQETRVGEIFPKEADFGFSAETERLNYSLRQAMSSGDIENLQAALDACAKSGCRADESLMKKVKAALAKRVKRMEKAAALEEELSAALTEADSARLRLAVAEIERIPRFAVTFKVKLDSAKALLFEVEARERITENASTYGAWDQSSNVGDVCPSGLEKNKEAEAGEDTLGVLSEWSLEEKEKKRILDHTDETLALCSKGSDSLTWTDVNKGKRQKEKELGEVSTYSSVSCFREKEKGIWCLRQKGAEIPLKEVASSSLEQPTTVNSGPDFPLRPEAFLNDSLSGVQPLTPQSSRAPEIPPSLPIPLHASAASPLLKPSRSVIMPPRSSGRPLYCPSGHEPITPQLFPLSKVGSMDYLCEQRWGDDNPGLEANCKSMEGFSTGSHMTHKFPSQWWSPIGDSLQQRLQRTESQVQAGSTSDSSDSLASLLASIFQSNFSGSSFSTLFSTSFGEFPTSRAVPDTSVVKVATPMQPLLLTPASPVLNVHAQPFLPAKSQKSGGPSISTSVQQAPSVLYSCQPSNASDSSQGLESFSILPSSLSEVFDPPSIFPSPFAQANTHTGSGASNLHLERLNDVLILDHQDDGPSVSIYRSFPENDSSASSLQEVALLAASMEESCCICFDMPKDAALIPCGHRMCKGCAEEMHRIRRHCPICNRSIEAVLALYG